MENVYDRLLECEEKIFDEEFPEKNKKRANRRKKDVNKALRKRNISKHAIGWDWYNNLHQYSKNKIHCSCPWCAFDYWKSGLLTISDKKKEMSDNQKLKEYNTGLDDIEPAV